MLKPFEYNTLTLPIDNTIFPRYYRECSRLTAEGSRPSHALTPTQQWPPPRFTLTLEGPSSQPVPRPIRPHPNSVSLPLCFLTSASRLPLPHHFVATLPHSSASTQKTRSRLFNDLHTLLNSQFRASLLFCASYALFAKNTRGWGYRYFKIQRSPTVAT